MPLLLKRSTIRLLEASMETLNLALVGLASPSRIERREPDARFVPHAALIASALEFTLSACLLQADGDQTAGDEIAGEISADSGRFHRLFRRFIDLVEAPAPRASFLFEGIADPSRHRRRLVELTASVEPVLAWRAVGMQGGEGPSRQACMFAAGQVVRLMELLSESSRMRPYLETLPRPRGLITASHLDMELTDSSDRAMPVRLEPENPGAIPIAPGFLQQRFERRRDQWRADVGNANARLTQGTLDLPPRESVLTCFALGAHQLRTMLGVETLEAEHVWPFIASSLNQRGTCGPYWFLVRPVEHDLQSLRAHMSQAFRFIGGVTGQRRKAEFLDGLDALEAHEPLGFDRPLSQELRDGLVEVEEQRRQLVDNLARARDIEREVPEELATLIRQVAAGQAHAGRALEVLSSSEHQLPQPTRQYWARVLCSACSEFDDRMGLIGVLQDDELSHAHSNARKAIRWIDAKKFGPDFETSPSTYGGQRASL